MDQPAARQDKKRVKFSVTGNTAQTYDQAAFFYAITDVVKSSAYELATVTPAVSRFTNAQIGLYVRDKPAQVVNAHITDASASAVISTMIVEPARYEINGAVLIDQQYADGFQAASDFQTTRGSLPLDFICDGWSFLRLINEQQGTAATYNVTFAMNFGVDQRNRVIRTAPTVVKSSAS